MGISYRRPTSTPTRTTIFALIVRREGLPLGMFGEVLPGAVNKLKRLLPSLLHHSELASRILSSAEEAR